MHDHKAKLIIPRKINGIPENITINTINTDSLIHQIKHIDETNEELSKARNFLMNKITITEKQMIQKLNLAEQKAKNHSALIDVAFDILEGVGQKI